MATEGGPRKGNMAGWRMEGEERRRIWTRRRGAWGGAWPSRPERRSQVCRGKTGKPRPGVGPGSVDPGGKKERERETRGWVRLLLELFRLHLGQLELLLPWRGIRVDQDRGGREHEHEHITPR